MKQTISFVVDSYVVRAIDKYAEGHKITRSEVIRKFLLLGTLSSAVLLRMMEKERNLTQTNERRTNGKDIV